MQLKRRKLAVRLTPESIPFRDGVIRMALTPFPRKRKDGTYKLGQNSTPYLVFPDNSACEFNLIFDLAVPLAWTDKTLLTMEERDDLDAAAWDIMRKYGLLVGAFDPNVFSSETPEIDRGEKVSNGAGTYCAWIANEAAAVPEPVTQSLAQLLQRATTGKGAEAVTATDFLVSCETNGHGFGLTRLLESDAALLRDMTHVFQFVLSTGRAPQRDCLNYDDNLDSSLGVGWDLYFWVERNEVDTDEEAIANIHFVPPVPVPFDMRTITADLDLALSELFACVEIELPKGTQFADTIKDFLFSWWLPEYFGGVRLLDLHTLPVRLRAAINVVWLCIIQNNARPPSQYRDRFEQLLAAIPDVLRPEIYRDQINAARESLTHAA